MHRIKPVLLLMTSLIISLSVFGGADKSSDKATTESRSVEITESVQVLQLTGTVIDERNNETLAGASIVVDGKKYYSDLDGNFAIADVLPGKYELTVELISYEPVTMEVDLSKDQTLNIGLLQK
ncbi:MAG: carboxypeptidase-like regulatory domain-containing protein [Bacteroidales bacterium]|jgi:hypothetical protein|nr:carboxypeptidase-like regulatory domain-containing protein [Bacteroidales bacterium]